MINPLALLSIFLGLIAIGLAIKLSMMVERKTNEAAGWRIYARHLQGQADKRRKIGCGLEAAGCGPEAEDSPSGPQLTANSPQQERSDHSLQAAALDLIAECELVERRNDFLEARWLHCKDVVALSMAQSRIPKRCTVNMHVAETQEAP